MNLEDVLAGWNGCVCSGEGGGGGGEDITTATITFINTGGEGTVYGVNIPSVIYDDCFDYNHVFLDPESYSVTDSTDVIATLYKGKVIYPLNSIYDGDADTMPTSSGGVSIDMENNAIVVTGDGTLTWVGSDVL